MSKGIGYMCRAVEGGGSGTGTETRSVCGLRSGSGV